MAGYRHPRGRKPNAKGRTDKAARFTKLPHRVLESAAYASCDPVARCLLAEIVMLYNSTNNGSLYLSVRDAAARIGLADGRSVQRAFDHLRECRLIELAKDAHFAVKAADTSRARCWRIAWEAWPECPLKARRAPCWDFEQYQLQAGKESTRAQRRLLALSKYRKEVAAGRLPVVDSTTTEAIMAQLDAGAVVESTTGKSETDAIPPFAVVGDSTTHLDNTMGRWLSVWWRSDAEADLTAQIICLLYMTQNRRVFARAA